MTRPAFDENSEMIAQEHMRYYEAMLISPHPSERLRAVNIFTAEGHMDDRQLLYYLENNLDKRFLPEEYAIVKKAVFALHEKMINENTNGQRLLLEFFESEDQVLKMFAGLLLFRQNYFTLDDFLLTLENTWQPPEGPFKQKHSSMKYLANDERNGELHYIFDFLFTLARDREENRGQVVDFLIDVFLNPHYYA